MAIANKYVERINLTINILFEKITRSKKSKSK
jgi:hypothetical protein